MRLDKLFKKYRLTSSCEVGAPEEAASRKARLFRPHKRRGIAGHSTAPILQDGQFFRWDGGTQIQNIGCQVSGCNMLGTHWIARFQDRLYFQPSRPCLVSNTCLPYAGSALGAWNPPYSSCVGHPKSVRASLALATLPQTPQEPVCGGWPTGRQCDRNTALTVRKKLLDHHASFGNFKTKKLPTSLAGHGFPGQCPLRRRGAGFRRARAPPDRRARPRPQPLATATLCRRRDPSEVGGHQLSAATDFSAVGATGVGDRGF